MEISQNSFWRDVVIYASRVKEFSPVDWVVYVVWVGMMYGLLAVVGGFLLVGHFHGVQYPIWVWNIPLGIFIFSTSIAFDTIGHRTIYKDYLAKGEALVHHITIVSGVGSCVLLVMAYDHPNFLRIPIIVLIFLSVFYSGIDEAMHWFRYMSKNSDRVEMWSHYGIFLGHLIMIIAWWQWYDAGYPGVAETLVALNQLLG